MRFLAVASAVVFAFVPAGVAQDSPPFVRYAELEVVAAVFAARPVEVRCARVRDDANLMNAWGYYRPVGDYIVLEAGLCEGMLRIRDGSVAAWKRGVGPLILAHESFHARQWAFRFHEGRVECRAIRNFRKAAELLGAAGSEVEELFPQAMGAHRLMVSLGYVARCSEPSWRPWVLFSDG